MGTQGAGERAGKSRAFVTFLLERLCVRELAEAGHFSIPKVAKLVVETRRSRRGRDPITGKALEIPARRVVRARISGSVRMSVEAPL